MRVERGERVRAGGPSLGDLRRSRPVDRRLLCRRVLVAGGAVTRTSHCRDPLPDDPADTLDRIHSRSGPQFPGPTRVISTAAPTASPNLLFPILSSSTPSRRHTHISPSAL